MISRFYKTFKPLVILLIGLALLSVVFIFITEVGTDVNSRFLSFLTFDVVILIIVFLIFAVNEHHSDNHHLDGHGI